ncbi:hypothetical protein PO909_015629 [Leuciscus waleckii]
MHGRSARSSQTQRHASAELFGRLADPSSITITARGAQNHFTRSPRESWYHGQLDEEFTEPQSNDFVSGYHSGLTVYDSAAVATARAAHSARGEIFTLRRVYPAQDVSKDARSHGLSITSSSAGLAPHAPSAVLVESASTARSVGVRPAASQGQSELCDSPDTLVGGRLVPIRCKPGDFLGSEDGVDRRIHLGMGSAARGQTVLRPVVETRKAPTHQLPGNAGSAQCANALLSTNQGPTRRSPFGQQGRGVLYKSPGRSEIHIPVQAGETPPNMGSAQFALAESSACAWAPECGPRQTVQEQHSPGRMVSTPANSRAVVGEIRQSGGGPIRVPRKRSLPRVLFQEQQRAVPHVAALPALCLSPRLPPASGVRAGQGNEMLSAACSTVLEEPSMVPSPDAASRHRSMASAIEERSPLAGRGLDLAPTPGTVVPSRVGAQRLSVDLAEGVINTITQARAPSTRRLYASKWSVFSGWCTARSLSPLDCEVTEVLSFLQELLDKGRSPSTLKVYVAAITAFSGTTLGQSLGRNDLVICFLRGARRLNPPRPPSVPMWDLSTVLAAMKVKRIGDLHALSVSPACLEFGPNDSKVILKPKHGYVPKSLNTPFRAQVISLSALPGSTKDIGELKTLIQSLKDDPTDEEEVVKGMNVGLLVVTEKNTAKLLPKEIIDVAVVLEEEIVLDGLKDVSNAFAVLMGLLYALDITYPKEYTRSMNMLISPAFTPASSEIHSDNLLRRSSGLDWIQYLPYVQPYSIITSLNVSGVAEEHFFKARHFAGVASLRV